MHPDDFCFVTWTTCKCLYFIETSVIPLKWHENAHEIFNIMLTSREQLNECYDTIMACRRIKLPHYSGYLSVFDLILARRSSVQLCFCWSSWTQLKWVVQCISLKKWYQRNCKFKMFSFPLTHGTFWLPAGCLGVCQRSDEILSLTDINVIFLSWRNYYIMGMEEQIIITAWVAGLPEKTRTIRLLQLLLHLLEGKILALQSGEFSSTYRLQLFSDLRYQPSTRNNALSRQSGGRSGI